MLPRDDVPLWVSRAVLLSFACGLRRINDAEMYKDVAHYALERLQPAGAVLLEDHIEIIRRDLAKVYEGEGRLTEAAACLKEINVEGCYS